MTVSELHALTGTQGANDFSVQMALGSGAVDFPSSVEIQGACAKIDQDQNRFLLYPSEAVIKTAGDRTEREETQVQGARRILELLLLQYNTKVKFRKAGVSVHDFVCRDPEEVVDALHLALDSLG